MTTTRPHVLIVTRDLPEDFIDENLDGDREVIEEREGGAS